MKSISCIIDCRVDRQLDNDFLALNLWGKPLCTYVIEECLKVQNFTDVKVWTDSAYIAKCVHELFPAVEVLEDCRVEGAMLVSGRAAFVKAKDLSAAVETYEGKGLVSVKECWDYGNDAISFCKMLSHKVINAFRIGHIAAGAQEYLLDETSSCVVNSRNDFELALVLKKKEINAKVLRQSIDKRIEEKTPIMSKGAGSKELCLVGHSQLDNWKIDRLGDLTVRNCGIAGISSFEYRELILDKDILDCNSELFVVMHGTNDIVYDYSLSEIADSALFTINYIKAKNPSAKIMFVKCLPVNGRMDRSNDKIKKLNAVFEEAIGADVKLINVDCFGDEFGNLAAEYTVDGLHLSDKGYELLEKIILEAI